MKILSKLFALCLLSSLCACATMFGGLPTSSEHLARGEGYHKDGKIDEAMKEYNKALKINPNNVDVYASRGAAYFYKKEYESAALDFLTVVENKPANAPAYSALGAALAALEKYEEALVFVNYSIAINPQNAEAYLSRGSINFSLGRYDDALEDYHEVVRLRPSVTAYVARASAYEKLGKQELADKDIETAKSGSLPMNINSLVK